MSGMVFSPACPKFGLRVIEEDDLGSSIAVFFNNCTFDTTPYAATIFDNCVLHSVTFENCHFSSIIFQNVFLSGIRFTNCRFENAWCENWHPVDLPWNNVDRIFGNKDHIGIKVPREILENSCVQEEKKAEKALRIDLQEQKDWYEAFANPYGEDQEKMERELKKKKALEKVHKDQVAKEARPGLMRSIWMGRLGGCALIQDDDDEEEETEK